VSQYNFIKNNRIAITVSISMLVLLYWQIDFLGLVNIFLKIDITFLLFGLLMVLPITMLTALRLTWLSPNDNRTSYVDSLRLILAASVMNLVLPSKMGDIVKSAFMVKSSERSYEQNLSLVIFEKIGDFLSLLLWCIFGLFLFEDNNWMFSILLSLFFTIGLLSIISNSFSRFVFMVVLLLAPDRYVHSVNKLQYEWLRMVSCVNKQQKKFYCLLLFSLFLWFLHLFQLWIFILSLGGAVPFLDSLAITPLAIFIGLLPLSFSGIGTRDLAFVYFYSSFLSAATGAALGILATLRYLIPAIFGIPFFIKYMNTRFSGKI